MCRWKCKQGGKLASTLPMIRAMWSFKQVKMWSWGRKGAALRLLKHRYNFCSLSVPWADVKGLAGVLQCSWSVKHFTSGESHPGRQGSSPWETMPAQGDQKAWIFGGVSLLPSSVLWKDISIFCNWHFLCHFLLSWGQMVAPSLSPLTYPSDSDIRVTSFCEKPFFKVNELPQTWQKCLDIICSSFYFFTLTHRCFINYLFCLSPLPAVFVGCSFFFSFSFSLQCKTAWFIVFAS